MKILCYDNKNDLAFLLPGIKLYPFVFSSEYGEFIKDAGQKLFIATDEAGVLMPFKIFKTKFLTVAKVLFPPLKNGIRLTQEEEKKFLNQFVEHLSRTKLVDRIFPPENFCIFKTAPNGSVYAPFGTYTLHLDSQTKAELFASLHGKHRNVIRNAEKNNAIIKYGEDQLPVFFELYKLTMQRSNMYCEAYGYFSKFYKLLTDKNAICGVVYYNNIPQGALLMPFSHYGAFYLYGASANEIKLTGAMNYLHWNTINVLKERGVKQYDFVGARLSDIAGTKLEGVQKFKERFGAELQKGIIWKMNINRAKCIAYDALLKIKCKLKGTAFPTDIIEQELKAK